jgi:hypothetical protein
LVKFVSEPASPPQLVEVPEERKAKAKERREVGEGDDTVVVEDTSEEDDDEETLQERFQLRSRFSCPGLPHVPLVQVQPASLEASLPTPPRKPRNVACKRVAKKLKVSGTTSQEVSLSYGPPRAHYLSGYHDRLPGGPLGLPDLRCTVPDGVKHKDCGGEVLG